MIMTIALADMSENVGTIVPTDTALVNFDPAADVFNAAWIASFIVAADKQYSKKAAAPLLLVALLKKRTLLSTLFFY